MSYLFTHKKGFLEVSSLNFSPKLQCFTIKEIVNRYIHASVHCLGMGIALNVTNQAQISLSLKK